MTVDVMALESAAKQARGNWRKFDSFAWHDRPDDADDFAIVYTHNRDSDIIAESNAAVIGKALEPFMEGDNPEAFPEHYGHWACGWIDGFAIRVYRDGEITESFRVYHGLLKRMADYPILDEDDHSKRELEAIDKEWEGWARRDFERAIERKYPDMEFTFPDTIDLRELFNNAADSACECWYSDWSGYSIHINRIADSLTLDDLEGCYVQWRVTWIDCGECAELYLVESEAIALVESLRASGFIGASYMEVR